MRLDLRKLRFRQPKLVATHLCLLFGSRESRHYVRANTFMGPDPSANTDSEILNAVRPALATTNGLLAIISSPYARRGEVWNLFNRHYGLGGDPEILVAKGATRDFNPSLPQRTVDRALERDPIVAASEWMG